MALKLDGFNNDCELHILQVQYYYRGAYFNNRTAVAHFCLLQYFDFKFSTLKTE